MVLCYCLALVSLSVLLSLQPASGQGVSLEYNGVAVPNFGVGSHGDFSDIDDLSGHMVCRTDNTSCCRNGDNPINGLGFGNWYYPDGNVVLFNDGNLPSGQIYRQLRGSQIVFLFRVGSATTSTANGIYRCEVADRNGVIQTRYIGLYTETNTAPNGVGVVSVSGNLQLLLTDLRSSRFALMATTTDGPPTTFTWSGPSGEFSNADSTVTVLDSRTSLVRIQLMVTGNVPGVYTFTVSNPRTPNEVTAMLAVSAGDRPNSLNAVQEGSNIRVTWSAPDSGAPSNGYIVYYQAGSGQVQTEQTPFTQALLTTNLVNGAEHTIEVAAVANIPGVRAGPERVVFVLPPDPPEVTLSAVTATGVTVAWNSQEGVEQYEVQYTRAMGFEQLGACPDFADSGSQTTGGGATSLTLQDIEEFSTYDVMVVAVNSIARVPSMEMEIMTLSAVPSSSTVQVGTVTNITISISWMPLSCIELNSQSTVTDYTVRYGRVPSSNQTTVNLPASSTTFTVSNLEPGTLYFIEVAAVNSNGEMGVFSPPIVQTTDDDDGGVSSISPSPSGSVTAAVVLGVVFLLSLLLNAATIAVLVLKYRQSHTSTQQKLSDLSDAKISTAACEAYVAVQPAHGTQREAPQYEAISPQPQQAN